MANKEGKYFIFSPFDPDWFVHNFVGSTARYEIHPDHMNGVFKIKIHNGNSMYCELRWRNKADNRWNESNFSTYDPEDSKKEFDNWCVSFNFKGKVIISDTPDLVPVKEEPCLFTLPFNWTLNKNYVKSNPLLEQQLIDEAVKKGQSTARMTQREWPWGKRLGYKLDKAKDQIHFFWEPDRAANK